MKIDRCVNHNENSQDEDKSKYLKYYTQSSVNLPVHMCMYLKHIQHTYGLIYVYVCEAHTAYICTHICTRYNAIHIAYARSICDTYDTCICMYLYVSVCICVHLGAVSSAYLPVCRLHTGTYIHIWIDISVF